jgi:2-polyprenyl-6-methoxyphenol hydroxylase-like FAD-dependent oxidoreductase
VTITGRLPRGDVLVVGAGVAGLSTAISLARRGHRVVVVDHLGGALGASIIVGHGAVHALEALGVLDEVLAVGKHIRADEPSWWTHVYNSAGEQMPVPPPRLPTTGLPSMVFVYRPLLSDILVAAAREHGAEVHFNHTFTSLEHREEGVEAELTTGLSRTFDLVVGADGLNSTVRGLIFPELEGPQYTGAMSFRSMISDAPDHWLSGLHFATGGLGSVTTLLPGGLFYLAVGARTERRRIEPDEARGIVREALAKYEGSSMFAEITQRIDDTVEPIVAPYEWIWVPQPWHRRRVVLVGDTVHATTPNIGAAGGMAIEDGVVLAEELERAADLESGLTAYEERRLERTKLVVDASVEIMLRQQRVPREPMKEAAIRAAAIEKLAEPY